MTSPVFFGAKRRIILGGIDQAISSGQNVVLVFLVAHSTSSRDFGAFSIAYAMAVLGVGLGQALVGEPYLLSYSTSLRTLQERTGARCRSMAFALGVGLACLFAVAAVPAGSPLRACLFALALSCPGLLLVDNARYLAITQMRQVRLLSIDAFWTGAWLVGTLFLNLTTASGFLLVWGATATLTGVMYSWPIAIGRGSLSKAWFVWKAHFKKNAASLLGEYVTVNTSGQISLLIVAIFLGYVGTGGLRGAQALLGPISTLFNAMRVAVVPEVIRAGGSKSVKGRRLVRSSNAGAIIVAACLATALLLLPNDVGHKLLGETWHETSRVLLPMCLSRIAFAAEVRSLIALRADGRIRQMALARSVSVPLLDSLTILAALSGSIVLTAWAILVGIVAQLAILEWLERRHVG